MMMADGIDVTGYRSRRRHRGKKKERSRLDGQLGSESKSEAKSVAFFIFCCLGTK